MLLTVTLNPSVDISYTLEQFKIDGVNRATHVSKTAGGKGLNVTRVLHDMNEPVIATGLLGGDLGNYIKSNLEEKGIQTNFNIISEDTRNCIAILHEGNQTEILEPGPQITEEESIKFLKHFTQLVDEADVVIASGSLPQGLSQDYYPQLVKITQQKGKKMIVDSSGEALKQCLEVEQKPYLIKPNKEELAALLGYDMSTIGDQLLLEMLNSPLLQGIEWVVVSLGGDGAYAKHRDQMYRVMIPRVDVVNPVGSGDATVAGLGLAISQAYDDVKVLKTAMTAGILNAMEDATGHVCMTKFDRIFHQIKVERI